MPNNGHGHEEPVVLPPNILDMRTTERNNNNNRNNYDNSQAPYDGEQLLYALFYEATLGYARIFPRSLRSVTEFLLLFMAVLSFIVLVIGTHVHTNFFRKPANCLDHIKDIWPKDGILRVEFIQNVHSSHAEQTGTFNELFTLEKSYEREYKLKRMNTNKKNASFFNHKTDNLENKGEVNIEPSTEKLVENKYHETNTSKPNLFNYLPFTNYINLEEKSTKLPSIDDYEVIFYEDNIVEYSLEYEFLLLSPSARNQLGIPVMLVTLDPTQNKCLGNSVSRFFLHNFHGYDYLLMPSVISLAENEQKKGFLRIVMTGSSYIFSSISVIRSPKIVSFFLMVLLTVWSSMIWRFIHRLIFASIMNFMVSGLFNFHGTPFFLVAQLFISILAVVGKSIAISNILDNYTVAYPIMFIVVAAALYDFACSRLPITKKHWPMFFYLFHFSFYAYYLRFDGHNSNLALLCSWLFIQHSMVYFYHRYELPHVLLQAQQQAIIHRQHHQHQHQPTWHNSGGGDQQASPAIPEQPEPLVEVEGYRATVTTGH